MLLKIKRVQEILENYLPKLNHVVLRCTSTRIVDTDVSVRELHAHAFFFPLFPMKLFCCYINVRDVLIFCGLNIKCVIIFLTVENTFLNAKMCMHTKV